MVEDDYFEKVIEVEEMFARGQISLEEYGKRINELSSHENERLEESVRDLESNFDIGESIKKTNEMYMGMLSSLMGEVKNTERESNRTKIDLGSIASGVKNTVSETAERLNINKDSISDLGKRVSRAGKSVLDRMPKSVNIPSLKSVLPNKSECEHELFYFESEVSPYHFESQKFRDMEETKLVICKCLSCGKEINSSRSKLGYRLIEEASPSVDGYNKAKSYYRIYKNSCEGTEELASTINSKLNGEIVLKL